MSGLKVVLGVAGELVRDEAHVTPLITKVGGRPCYAEAATQQICCSGCGELLSLVLQAYAPWPLAHVTHRALYIYFCANPTCKHASHGWVAVRQQAASMKPASGEGGEASSLPDAKNGPPDITGTLISERETKEPASATDASMWDAEPSSWEDESHWATAAVSDALSSSGFIDLSDLNAALDAFQSDVCGAHATTSTQNRDNSRKKTEGAGSIGNVRGAGVQCLESAAPLAPLCCHLAPCGPVLPAFYLCAVDEPQEKMKGVQHMEDEAHVQELLQRYEAEGSCIAPAGDGPSPSGSDFLGGQGVGLKEEDGSFMAEEYEQDQVRGVSPTYVKFYKKMQRCPQQCARYSLGGPYLWPLADRPMIPQCPHCGAPRQFELQLMPPLTYMIEEAAEMILNEGTREPLPYDRLAMEAVEKWDWCTVAVFTCSKSCGSPERDTVVEEYVRVVREESCHERMLMGATSQAA